jgi:hypothetical protein
MIVFAITDWYIIDKDIYICDSIRAQKIFEGYEKRDKERKKRGFGFSV